VGLTWKKQETTPLSIALKIKIKLLKIGEGMYQEVGLDYWSEKAKELLAKL
jgi:hypothetical protein